MAAGLGFKTFNTGDVLTASDTNGYLMQGIWVFANAAARDAAVTSPQEGNACYLKDTDVIQVYSGSAWVTKSGGSPLTTKGDLYTYSTSDTRLAIGTTNGHVLQVDSTAATGMKWAAAPASTQSFTLLNAGGTALTGNTTITVSSLSGYNQLYITWNGASTATSAADLSLRFNSDTGTNYVRSGMWFGWGASSAVTGNGSNDAAASAFNAGKTASAAATHGAGGFHVFGANSTGIKPVIGWGTGQSTGGEGWLTSGHYAGTAVISSVSIISNGGNFDAGTIFIYGA